jgi:phenylpropionate dioxygenase-like ring-hydroxylating dioxygenase large terminal subunit
MIKNQWYGVMDAKEVKIGKIVFAKRMGELLAFFQDSQGKICCVADKCAHRGAGLHLGKIQGDHIECPFHGLQYDHTGRCQVIPANGYNTVVPPQFQVKGYPVREEHGFIWLWWGEERETYPEIKYFTDLDRSFSYGTVADPWKIHYSRAIENQLDVAHLPFVHYNTIGRGNRRLVNGPIVLLEDDHLRLWSNNQVDDGKTIPLKAEQMEKSDSSASLHFIYPNKWQLHIADKMRIVVVFAPVDDENTVLYLRYYQKFVTTPILKNLVSYFGSKSNLVVAHQDRRIVETQLPKKSDLQMDEKLFQADNPIIQYRKHRKELQEKAG